MAIVPYLGTYLRFSTTQASQDGLLMSADCLVGDELDPVCELADGVETIWLENRFGARVGKLDATGVGHVQLCQAKDWDIRLLLASVYCRAVESAPRYWGEVVLIAYPKTNAESFGVFAQTVSGMLGDGIRPQVDLRQSSLAQIAKTKGAWKPSGRVDALKPGDSALVKDSRSMTEKLVEQARARNSGCMVIGWLFTIAVLACVGYLVLRALGVAA